MPPARLALYCATAGVLAVTGFSVLSRPLPLGVAGLVLCSYAALLLSGVFVLRWRVFADAIVRGPPGAQGVAITFDDGPHPTWTLRILEVLAQRGVTATFFVIGRKAEGCPELIQAILDGGHDLGLHSYDHDRLFALRSESTVRRDLDRSLAALEKLSGRRPTFFRPPIGHTNPAIARVAEELELAIVGWTVGGRDSVNHANPEEVVGRVRRRLGHGAIVLLHDSPERGDREPASIRALPRILDAILAAGLTVVPLRPWVDGAQVSAEGRTT